MSFLGGAILAFWADVEASGEADYNDWHTREHMPERCAVPGFLRGRRYVAVAAANRTACRTTLSIGRGIGGAMATIRLGPSAGREQSLRQWLTGEALPKLLERPGISAAHLCEADVETTTVKTAEKSIRDKPDEVARWVLLVEGIDADIVQRACADALGAAALERRGAEPGAITGVYLLHYVL